MPHSNNHKKGINHTQLRSAQQRSPAPWGAVLCGAVLCRAVMLLSYIPGTYQVLHEVPYQVYNIRYTTSGVQHQVYNIRCTTSGVQHRIKKRPLTSSHLISSHPISSHLIPSHLISSHLISSHAEAQYNAKLCFLFRICHKSK